MDTTTISPVTVYTEMTPNPESMKFVADRMLLPNAHVEFTTIADASVSPLATELFGFPFVKGVFIMNNFVTLNKLADTEWQDVIPDMRDFIKKYLEEKKPVFNKDFVAVNRNAVTAQDES